MPVQEDSPAEQFDPAATLQQFFNDMPAESGMAFVVLIHLSPEHGSNLASIIQQKTSMPVLQVTEPMKLKPNHVYVIPPNKQLTVEANTLHVVDPQQPFGQNDLQRIERKIRAGETGWYLTRIAPYRTGEDRIAGVVATFIDITRRRHAEMNLESELRFRAMFEQASVGIVQVAEGGRFLAANPGFCEFIGYTEKELMRMGVRDVTHPDDFPREAELTRQLAAGEISEYTLEKRYLRKDAGILWGSMTAKYVRPEGGQPLYTLAIIHAIGDRKQAEEGLRTSEERFRLLVEGARDYAMFLLDTENEITYWNTGAERVFGWSAEEAVGQKGDIIFIPEDKAKGSVEKELSSAIEQGYAPDRRWHLRKDGSRFWADGVMRRIDHKDGSLRGFAKIARDASDVHRKEDELTHAHDELEQRVHHRTSELQAMNETLEQEMTRRQRLESEILEVTERERARISQDLHDSLCQELTATAFLMKSRAKALSRTDPEAGEALSEAAEAVNRNAGLARDLARGLHPLELGPGGLVAALRELASRTSQTVTCRCECPRSLRIPNENVALNLYRVAQEAVTNALKHAKPREVVICIERAGDEIVLAISDDGTPHRQSKKNAGLGIQMMQYRANVSGGTLKFESRKGKGTKVTCRVPTKQ